MKLSVCMAVLAIAAAPSLHAQSKKTHTKTAAKAEVNYKVSWGPDLKLKGNSPNDILLYTDEGFYATTDNVIGSSFLGFSVGGNSDFLAKFDNNMQLVLQAKLETEKTNKKSSDHSTQEIIEFNNGIYVVTKEKDKTNKIITFYIEKVNLSTLVPDGNKTKLYEISYADEKKKQDAGIGFFTDKDKKYLIVYEQDPAIEKGDQVAISVCAYDGEFNQLWKKQVGLPLENDPKKEAYFDKYIDPAGNIYLLAKVYFQDENGKKKNKFKDVKEGQLNYDYHIYMIGKDVPTFVDYAFNLKDKAVSQIHLDANAKGEMVACGFYGDINADKNKVSGAKGVFYTIIDPVNNVIKAQSYKQFDNTVYTAGLSEKRADKLNEKMEEGKKEGDASDYIIRDLVPRKDGGSTMFAEEYYKYVVTYYNKYGNTYTTHYVYRNIVVTKINSSGEIEWTTVIPKLQDVTGMTEICSYLKFDEGTDTYDIFFNDHRDNLVPMILEKKGAQAVNGKLKFLRFARIVVNPDGSLSKREEAFKMNEDDEDTRFYPRESKVVSDNEIILFGVDHKKDKFAKISFSDIEAKK